MAEGSKVAERVRNYRERLSMTVETLAEKSGVSAAVITAVEAGEVYPALGVLVKLSRALGHRLGTFMDDQYKDDPLIDRAERVYAAVILNRFHQFRIVCKNIELFRESETGFAERRKIACDGFFNKIKTFLQLSRVVEQHRALRGR